MELYSPCFERELRKHVHHKDLNLQDIFGYDYYDFLNSFNGEGFSLLINLAEGGNFPGTSDVLVDGQPQYVVVQSAKAYGF